MNLPMKYECRTTNNSIKYLINYKTMEASMADIVIKDKYIKAHYVLLRESIDDLTRRGIKYIYQNVTKEDWDNYLKDNTTWKIVKIYPNILTVKCGIDKCLENLLPFKL